MSGHSKWATIRHKKGAADSKRGKLFTKIIKEIIVSARMGGGDGNSNPRLRTALLKAKTANMPKDNIERAIKKGTGELEGIEYVELSYEGYGPGGVALLIEVLTDNKNRTAADIRYLLAKGGGNLGETGCVSYLFKRKGLIYLDAAQYTEDKVMEVVLEGGAQDISTEGGEIEVVTDPENFEAVLKTLETNGIQHSSAEISKVPETTIALEKEATRKVIRLIENLEDNDDVQSVATNLDIPDDFEME